MCAASWSNWYRFDSQPLEAPNSPGIYEIRIGFEFGRLRGNSSTVYIGKTTSLRRRLLEQRRRNPTRYMSRAEKLLQRAGHYLECRYLMLQNGAMVNQSEVQELAKYEEEHWELPPGNGNMPRRGIIEESQREAKPLLHNNSPSPYQG